MPEAARIKPPMGPDNRWGWEMAGQGKLGIQRFRGRKDAMRAARALVANGWIND